MNRAWKWAVVIVPIYILIWQGPTLYSYLSPEPPKTSLELKAELESSITFYEFVRSTIIVDISQAEAMIPFEEEKNRLFYEWSGLPNLEDEHIPKNPHERAIDSILQKLIFKKEVLASYDSLLIVYRDSIKFLNLESSQ